MKVKCISNDHGFDPYLTVGKEYEVTTDKYTGDNYLVEHDTGRGMAPQSYFEAINKPFNILIRNYTSDKDSTQLVVIMNLVTGEFKEELERKKKLLFDDPRLTDKFIAEIQPNGNLCIDYNIDKYRK